MLFYYFLSLKVIFFRFYKNILKNLFIFSYKKIVGSGNLWEDKNFIQVDSREDNSSIGRTSLPEKDIRAENEEKVRDIKAVKVRRNVWEVRKRWTSVGTRVGNILGNL